MEFKELVEIAMPASIAYQVPLELILAIIYLESSGRADAISPLGAVGLMQVMPCDAKAYESRPDLAKQFKDRPTTEQLLDPEFNVMYGTKLLSSFIKMYSHDPIRGVIAYYVGPGNVPKEGEITHPGAKLYARKIEEKLNEVVRRMSAEFPMLVRLMRYFNIPERYESR